jgi:hypothetical protein
MITAALVLATHPLHGLLAAVAVRYAAQALWLNLQTRRATRTAPALAPLAA